MTHASPGVIWNQNTGVAVNWPDDDQETAKINNFGIPVGNTSISTTKAHKKTPEI